MQKKILQDVQDSLKKATGMPVRELGEKVCAGLKSAVLKGVSPAGDDSSLREKAESLLEAARAAAPNTKNQAQVAFSDSLKTVHSLCLAGAGRIGTFVSVQSTPLEKWSGFSRAVGGNSSPQNTPPQPQRRPDVNSSAPSRGNYSVPPSTYSVPSVEGEKTVYRAGRMTHRSSSSRSPVLWGLIGILAIGAAAAGCYLLFQSPKEPEAVISVADSLDQFETSTENLEAVAEMPLASPIDDGKPAQKSRSGKIFVPKQVELTRDGVNLRDGHSTKGTNILARLDRQRMNVLERWDGEETWYRLETDQGVGWVISLYLRDAPPLSERKSAPVDEKKPAPAATKSAEKPAVKTTPGFVKGQSVNVRDGHSTKGTNILTKFSNCPVEILDSWHGKGDPHPWYKIRLENGEGWIYGQYIELR